MSRGRVGAAVLTRPVRSARRSPRPSWDDDDFEALLHRKTNMAITRNVTGGRPSRAIVAVGLLVAMIGAPRARALSDPGSITGWGAGRRSRVYDRRRGGRGGFQPQSGPEGRRLDRGVGMQRLRPVQRAGAEHGLRGGRGGRVPQPGPEGRRLDRGVGTQRLRPMQRAGAEHGLRGGRGGRGTTAWA